MFDTEMLQRSDAEVIQSSRQGAVLHPEFNVRSDDALVASSAVKRCFDAGLALSLLLAFLPGMILIALIIKAESRGPAIFRQRRTGIDGKVFTILKFRSMRTSEDNHLIQHAQRKDNRVTRFGSILRKTSLDELPQLINILRGDMSFVGPRPHALAHDLKYGRIIPEYKMRFRTRPGLTGLAQVCGFRGGIEEMSDMVQRVEKDNEYITSWSFQQDILILLKTVPIICIRKNAY